MTAKADRAALRDGLCQAHASEHAACADGTAASAACRRDTRSWLASPSAGRMIDIRYGHRGPVQLMLADRENADSAAVSPKQVFLAQSADQNGRRHGDCPRMLIRLASDSRKSVTRALSSPSSLWCVGCWRSAIY